MITYETERATKEVLKLSREWYKNDKLKEKDGRAAKLADFDGIANKFSIRIRVYEPKENLRKTPCRLV